MLAGVITFSTVYIAFNAKEPIVVNIDSFSDFKLTNSTNSTKYNSFSFVLDNQGKRAVGVRASDFVATSPGMNLTSWKMSRDYELSSLQSYYITVNTKSNNQSDWLSFNTSVTIHLIAFGLEDSYDVIDKADISSSITINSEIVSNGPIRLDSPQIISRNGSYVPLSLTNNSNNTLEIDVQNYGNVPVNYSLEFIVSNMSLSITTNYKGSLDNLTSIIPGYLPSASENVPSSSASYSNTVVLTVTGTPSGTTDYYVIIWLKIESTIQDTLIVVCQ